VACIVLAEFTSPEEAGAFLREVEQRGAIVSALYEEDFRVHRALPFVGLSGVVVGDKERPHP